MADVRSCTCVILYLVCVWCVYGVYVYGVCVCMVSVRLAVFFQTSNLHTACTNKHTQKHSRMPPPKHKHAKGTVVSPSRRFGTAPVSDAQPTTQRKSESPNANPTTGEGGAHCCGQQGRATRGGTTFGGGEAIVPRQQSRDEGGVEGHGQVAG